MKILIALSVFLLYLIFVGVPYNYEREYFLIVDSPGTDIKISIDSTVKKTFLGMPVVHGPPYKISIFCFDEGCLPEINKIIVKTEESAIPLEGEDPIVTKGGLNTLATPVEFYYIFNKSELFVVSLSIKSAPYNLKWSFRHEATNGFSLLPLWVYFTH